MYTGCFLRICGGDGRPPLQERQVVADAPICQAVAAMWFEVDKFIAIQ